MAPWALCFGQSIFLMICSFMVFGSTVWCAVRILDRLLDLFL